MEEKKSTGFSDIFKDIMKSPAVLVTLIVGAVLLIFILVNSNKNAITASGGPGSSSGQSQNGQNGPGYYLQEDTIVEPAPSVSVSVGNAPVPTPTPTPPPKPAPLTESAVQAWILQQQNASSVIDAIESAYRAAHPQPKPNPDTKAKGKAVRG